MSLPRVYAAINAVASALAASGIAKRHINLHEQYAYRSVDDVYNEVGPLLATHRLCTLPRVLKRRSSDRTDADGNTLVHVVVQMAFDLVSAEDGSTHTVEAFGEALDPGDKATPKAMQSAFKYALLQSLCIPMAGVEDADAASLRLKQPKHVHEPVQGWQQWTSDICELIGGCESDDAITRAQSNKRELLLALSRERRDLYDMIGAAVGERRQALQTRLKETKPKTKPPTTRSRRSRAHHPETAYA